MEIVELTVVALDHGISWTSDLLGNAGALDHAETMAEAVEIIKKDNNVIVEIVELNDYFGEKETVEWWEDYIRTNAEADLAVLEFADTLQGTDFDNYNGYNEGNYHIFLAEIGDACGGDYEAHAQAKLDVIEAWKNKIIKAQNSAASTAVAEKKAAKELQLLIKEISTE